MRFPSWLSSLSRSARLSLAKIGTHRRAQRRQNANRAINALGEVELLENRLTLSASPVFGSSSYTFSVPEVSSSTLPFGTVSATDADNDIMGYSITASSPGWDFSIDWTTGEISVSGLLDYEDVSRRTYTLTVTVGDMEGNTDTATVTVNVTDVLEDPVFSPNTYSFSISEDAAWGDDVGTPLLATDPQNDINSYSITAGNPNGDFSIDWMTGQIKVAGNLDYEDVSRRTYTLTVQVQDMYGHSDTATVTVNVTDVLEAPIFSPNNYSFSVAENAAWGDDVGTPLLATDPQNDINSYSITAGDPNGDFSIDSMTGQIKVAGNLDYEDVSRRTYTLNVQVQDMYGHSDTATVTINVTDYQPTINLEATTVVGWEGGMLDALIRSSSPDGPVELYEFDFNDDGVFEVSATHDTDFDGDDESDGTLVMDIASVTTAVANGDSGSYTGKIRVHVDGEYEDFDLPITIGNVPPSYDITDSGVGAPSTPYNVTVSISAESIDTISAASINWGDGTTDAISLTGGSLSHTYAATGSYVVTLTVTDEDGSYVANDGIEIGDTNAPLVPSTAPRITSAVASIQGDGTAILTITVEDYLGNPVASIQWDIGSDGSYTDASGSSVTISPTTDAFPYVAEVEITDSFGNTETALFAFAADGPVTPEPTKNNYAEHFRKATPDCPPAASGWSIHHTKQQALADRYLKEGINVHRTEYLKGVPDVVHDEISAQQNRWWAKKAKELGVSATQAKQIVPLSEIQAFENQLDQTYSKWWLSAGTNQKNAVTSITDDLNKHQSDFVLGKQGRAAAIGVALTGIALLDLFAKNAVAANKIRDQNAGLNEFKALAAQYDACIDQVSDIGRVKHNMGLQLKDKFRDFWTAKGVDAGAVAKVDTILGAWIDLNLSP